MAAPDLGRVQAVLDKCGVNTRAWNWSAEADLVTHISLLLAEVEAEFRMDVQLQAVYAGPTDSDHLKVLAAAAEWKASGYALLRPQIFKLVGEHARLQFENAEEFNNVIDRLIARGNELVNAVIGNIEFLPAGTGHVSDGFFDPCGNRYKPPVTLHTRF